MGGWALIPMVVPWLAGLALLLLLLLLRGLGGFVSAWMGRKHPKDTDPPAEVVVTVTSGEGLKAVNTGASLGLGKSDPFVRLCMADQQHETEVIKETLDPVWKKTFVFRGVTEQHLLTVTCLDWNRIASNTPLGKVVVPATEMHGKDEWYELRPTEGCTDPVGRLRLQCSAKFPPGSPAAQRLQIARKAEEICQSYGLPKEKTISALKEAMREGLAMATNCAKKRE